jgi:hypothetical protein
VTGAAAAAAGRTTVGVVGVSDDGRTITSRPATRDRPAKVAARNNGVRERGVPRPSVERVAGSRVPALLEFARLARRSEPAIAVAAVGRAGAAGGAADRRSPRVMAWAGEMLEYDGMRAAVGSTSDPAAKNSPQ